MPWKIAFCPVTNPTVGLSMWAPKKPVANKFFCATFQVAPESEE